MDADTAKAPTLILKKSKGLALVVLLSLLPLLMTALLGVAAIVPLFSRLSVAEDHCRMGTLTAQAELLNSLAQLIQLSELNKKLYHLEMKSLKLVKISAANPAALKAALALLKSVRSSQSAINVAQSSLIVGTEVRAHHLLNQTAGKIARSQRYLGSSYLASMFHPEGARLQVQKTRQGSSDIYQPKSDFEQIQKVSGSWDLNPLPHLEPWTERYLPQLGQIHIRCSAGVQKKGEKTWEPILLGVKRQLKLWG